MESKKKKKVEVIETQRRTVVPGGGKNGKKLVTEYRLPVLKKRFLPY